MDIDISKILRDNGYKVTPQRIAIYEALNDCDKHPDAEMLYEYLHETNPMISLATVYKTMEIFEKIGVISIIDVGTGSCLYDCVTEAHPHVYCERCGKVDDIFGLNMDAIFGEVQKVSHFKIKSTQMVFKGVCDCCSGK